MRKCKLGKIFVKAELYKLVEFIHWCSTASQATVAAVAIILKQGVAARDGALDHAAQLPHCARRDISAGSTHWGEAQRLELGMVLPVTGTPSGMSATYAPDSRKSRARDFILADLDNGTGPKENAALYTTNSPWELMSASQYLCYWMQISSIRGCRRQLVTWPGEGQWSSNSGSQEGKYLFSRISAIKLF